uniref:Leucine-rich repeat-containing N-terminal plant-type domain-containing protein n=1 Tax=Aegilops tauschii subsp. strangulata TaxID=200361 RepID=A0A452XQU7_AEGTS
RLVTTSFRAESLQALGLLPSSHTWICLSTILMDIPTFIDLPNLVYLSFSRNALSGPIPPSIGTLTKLVVLDLSFNGLNGSIPTSIDVPNLVYLNFSRNALSGPIPSSIGALTKIMVLDLSFNGLNGSIPTSLGLAPS